MSEQPTAHTFPSGEIKVGDAVEPSGYSRSYIIRLLNQGKVKGHQEHTDIGSYWMVDLADLMRYKSQEHKSGPKGQKLQRKKINPLKTAAAPGKSER